MRCPIVSSPNPRRQEAKISKVLKVVAVVAGIASVVLTAGASLGVIAPTILGASTVALAGIAGVIGMAASFGSQLLTKPPPARGSVNQLMIQVDPPQPYCMGRTYFGGVLRHSAAYGATLSGVPNPYLGRVVVYSGAGPIQGFDQLQVDYAPIGGYYSGWLYTSTQLGSQPEAGALAPAFAGLPQWTPYHKLSGQAAALWNFKFDKAGKVFASGLPNTGAIVNGVKVYDPRLDSTYPGGVGPQRLNDESTWAFSKNPALHAIAYAYGRYQNGKKVFGIGLPAEAIDLPAFVAWANVCDANGWTISGTVFEPDDRWKNLKDIMAAGGAEPVFSGAVLSVKYHAPRVSLDTITSSDLTEDGGSVTAMRSYRDRINTIVPKWRSEEHNWEYTAGAPIVLSTALADDGEEKKEERQYNLVDNSNQSAQLAAYELLERRELGVIELSCNPRVRQYRPGECLTVNLPSEGLSNVQAVILRRTIEPGTMSVRLTLLGETPAKHDYALGRTATPPPTPALTQTPEERDDIGQSVIIGTPGPAGPAGPAGADGPAGSPGPAGAPATSAYLTNESAQLFAYANGNVASYAGANGEFKVFAGSTDISASFSLSTVANPQALTVEYAGRAYAVTGGFDETEDTATVTIRATGGGAYAGVAFDKVFSLSKAKGGYEIVPSLPTTNLFSGRVVFNEADDKLYRYTGTAWTKAVDTTDLTGQIADTQIEAVSAAKISGQIANSQINAVAAAKITGALTDGQIAAIAAAKLTGQIVGTQITDGAISTEKVAAGAITAAQIAADTITAAQIAAGAITATELAAGSVAAGKIAAGSVSTTELAAGSVVAEKIAAGAVSADKIGANSVTASKLLIGDLNNLVLNGDLRSGTLDGWSRITATGGNAITVDTGTGWPSQYALVLSRAAGNASELSIVNGNTSFDDTSMREGIALAPGEELWFESTTFTTNAGAPAMVDCVARVNDTTLAVLPAYALSNCVESLGKLTAAGGFIRFSGYFRNNTGAPVKAYIRLESGNAGVGTAVYFWNTKALRRNTGEVIVDGAILANKIAANAVTADKIEAGAVTAAKIAVTQLSAISATIGLLRTASSGSRLEIENNQVRVYDGANVLRVRMGVW